MNTRILKKTSDVFTIAAIILVLIALLFGFSFIKIGAGNLIAVDNVKIDIETFKDNAEIVEGTIISTDTSMKTVIEFDVEGETQSQNLEVYSDEFKAGDKITVYYSKDDPSVIRVPELFISYYDKSGKTTLKIGIIVVAVCGGLALLLFIAIKIMRRKIAGSGLDKKKINRRYKNGKKKNYCRQLEDEQDSQ